ncbi:thiosulfate oxidation carrier complex protein SoxZ [Aurantimonas sp. C2-6-R+9]|uniref:thiosulfate oxidation carrier complex protein SoxZ n=1 Tax=unclassified Aurantimonas TaxID=2638230 RepID=UPI002E1823F5|nr:MULTISPECIES: thiosulfate oxidation carrier complex protein SoxZ [unclassified Aurantimonas]MEC5289205.1 thiosulfate oxidation carrier complex protein SoxZ [Aurantimonas sp. C2-3-R2]MEC5323075.1 thiosulfate oxidation carrier complex protein SoxZ [Aurantimonas sp. A3-2-R12]MEC5380159.1 thiosulfate oxidation carrier complex protein SoxZ [Aurantimonas sp. C2-6-R+9]MEC5410345.1 thiosulfate oxidation carrier complex protein SoxZ [Aurantimonas sp. C2-4-R8]
MASKPRVKVPKSAEAGEVVTIKTLISHDMESGQRKDKEGNVIPRQIINKFTAEFNGAKVFETNLEPAVSANPYFEFTSKVPESGTFKFTWVDDNGETYTDEQKIEVK